MNSRSFVQKIPQGEERKRFTAEIRNKTAKVQNLRKRLEGLDNEMAVLNRTEQLLERRCLKLRKELGTCECLGYQRDGDSLSLIFLPPPFFVW